MSFVSLNTSVLDSKLRFFPTHTIGMSQSNGTWIETLALKHLGDNVYETVHNPERMGNALNIAYGGFALAVAVKSSYQSLPPNSNHQLYTMMGSYLGPALTDRPLRASVRTVRQTRTFATRQVEVSQKQADGTFRTCFIALADLQVPEKETMLQFSISPSRNYASYAGLADRETQAQKLVEQGKVSQQAANTQALGLGVLARLFDIRPCPEGIFAQNLTGMAKSLPTTQDGLPLTEKSTADWLRSKTALPDQSENVSLLAFFMDSALSFAPLAFSKMFLEDSSACSSLDFAIRIFSNSVSMDKWHLREIKTKVGSEGRTYNEAWMFDEEGKCVACMTQANILRPLKKKKEGNL